MVILLDLSKAFDRINRNKLRYILYESDPRRHNTYANYWSLVVIILNFAQNITIKNGPILHNNVGFFQGSRLNEQLFIMYVEHATNRYANKTQSYNALINDMIIRNNRIVYRRFNCLLQLKTRPFNIEIPTWGGGSSLLANTFETDYLISADDANAGNAKSSDDNKKLNASHNTAKEYGLLINWRKTSILTNNANNSTIIEIKSSHLPFNEISLTKKSKAIGHLMAEKIMLMITLQ